MTVKMTPLGDATSGAHWRLTDDAYTRTVCTVRLRVFPDYGGDTFAADLLTTTGWEGLVRHHPAPEMTDPDLLRTYVIPLLYEDATS